MNFAIYIRQKQNHDEFDNFAKDTLMNNLTKLKIKSVNFGAGLTTIVYIGQNGFYPDREIKNFLQYECNTDNIVIEVHAHSNRQDRLIDIHYTINDEYGFVRHFGEIKSNEIERIDTAILNDINTKIANATEKQKNRNARGYRY